MTEVSSHQHLLHSNSDQDASEASDLDAQSDPPTTESEESDSEVTNYYFDKFLDTIAEIRRRIIPLTDEDDSLSSGDEDMGQGAQGDSIISSNEDEIEVLSAGKILRFLTTILHVLLAAISIVIGYINIEECPGNFYLPYMILIMGPTRLALVAYIFLKYVGKNVNNVQENEQTMLGYFSGWFILLWLCEMGLFWFTDVSFNSSAANYCNAWLYDFVLVWNIFLMLSFALGCAALLINF